MTSNLLKVCGNRVALEEEANALREVIEKEKSTTEYLKRQYEEGKTTLAAEQLKAAAFSDAMKGINSLQQATKQLLQSIEHIQTTFISILPSQQHEKVASRIPVSDQFVVNWRTALDYLSTASDMLGERLNDVEERARATQAQLLVHESLRAHAAQGMARMDMIIGELNHSIEDKRLGILHPIRRLSSEIFKDIFEYAVDEEHAKLMSKIDSKISSRDRLPCIALHISATCRHWREIATQTPKLWRYIYAPWTVYEPNKLIGRTRFLRCLSLAGESGLELILRGEEEQYWEPIQECTKQWSHITTIDTECIPSWLPASSRLSIYSSTNVFQTVEYPDDLSFSPTVMSCSRTIPKFTSTVLKLTALVIHFPNISRLKFDLGVLLSFLPSLSQLTLKCDQDYSLPSSGARTVRTHNTLKILSIAPQFLCYMASELRYISIPSLTVLKILDLHAGFMKEHVLGLFEANNSIKDTVKDLYISSSKKVSKKTEISTLIRSFSQLQRLELHRFAVTPGLEALWDASMGPSLMQVAIVIEDYPEGKERLKEIIEAAGPIASSWSISY